MLSFQLESKTQSNIYKIAIYLHKYKLHTEIIHSVWSVLYDIVRNIIQACALIVQILQNDISPVIQRSFWVSQQREQGVIHLKSLACLRMT